MSEISKLYIYGDPDDIYSLEFWKQRAKEYNEKIKKSIGGR